MDRRGSIQGLTFLILLIGSIIIAVLVVMYASGLERSFESRPVIHVEGTVTIVGSQAYLTLVNNGKGAFNGTVCLLTPYGQSCRDSVYVPPRGGVSIEIPLSFTVPSDVVSFEAKLRLLGCGEYPVNVDVLRG